MPIIIKMNEKLLVDSRIDAVRQRLVYTLENIKFQKNVAFWDDIEKIEHCIKALENIEIKSLFNISKCSKVFFKPSEFLSYWSFSRDCFALSR